jgi:sirohydrochlorin ferrochelatase
MRNNYSFKIVEPAHLEFATPTIMDAYKNCVLQGATNIICYPFFLGRGTHVQVDIPKLMEEAAQEHPGTHFTITDPLGAEDSLMNLIANKVVETAKTL